MASPTEFLPFAWYLYKNNLAETFLDDLSISPESACPLFRTLKREEQKGFCGNYSFRGLVCRLFGYAARINKEGMPELATCKLIKEDQPDLFQKASEEMKTKRNVPIYSNYYQRLSHLEPQGKLELLPINEAIRKAVEVVLWDRFYRDKKIG